MDIELTQEPEVRQEIVTYQDPREVLPILEAALEEPQHQRYMSLHLVARHPKLLDRETVSLNNHYIIAVDFPGYSSVMSTFPQEGTLMFREARERAAELLVEEERFSDIMPLQNAGDEILSAVPLDRTSLLEVITFGLEAQIAFVETLNKYPEIKSYIETVKNLKPPYVHCGITHGDLSIRYVDLGKDAQTGEINKTDLMVMGGSSLAVKDIAKGRFTTVTSSALDTAETPKIATARLKRSTGKLNSPEISISKEEMEPATLAALRDAGVIVNWDKSRGLYEIEVADSKDAFEALEILQNAVTRLKEEPIDKPIGQSNGELKTINLTRLRETAKSCTNPANRKFDLRHPPHFKEGENQSIGDGAFCAIEGLEGLRKSLLSHGIPVESVNIAMAECSASILERISSVLTNEGGWDIEHPEFDAKDTAKLVALNNVFQLNLIHKGQLTENPEVFATVIKAIKLTKSSGFKELIVKDVLNKLGGKTGTGAIYKSISGLNLSMKVGLSSSDIEEDGLTWVLEESKGSETYAWGSPPTGSLTSGAARLWSSVAHGRLLERSQELAKQDDLTDEEKIEMEEISQNRIVLESLKDKSCIVTQIDVAKKLGILSKANVVIRGTQLKGLNRMGLAIFEI